MEDDRQTRAEREPIGFARLVDALPGLVFVAENRNGWPMKYLSAGCRDLTGYESGELVANPHLSYSNLTHPDDLPRVLEAMNRAAGSRQNYVIEYRIVTKAGEEKWVWEKGHVVLSELGEIESIEGFITDITPLKTTEQELQLAKKKYEDIFEHAREGIFQTSVKGAYLNVNPALAKMYGYRSPREMMAGITDIEGQLYVDPRRRSQFVAMLEECDSVVNFESEIRLSDGSVIWISENARAVRDAAGQLLYYEGSVVDVTARKRAEECLEKERNMLRTLIDNWPDVIYVRNREGRYLLSNMAHTRSLEMTHPSEVEGKRALDFFVATRAEQFSNEDLDLMEKGGSILHREETRNAGRPNEKWVVTTKLPLRNAEGDILGLVGITRDVSEYKRLEHQLRQSQKMEAVGTLAGGVAHDFNNILIAILGYSELIVNKKGQDEGARRDAEEIHAAGLRAAALTQQLLAFSRKQINDPHVLNLNSVVERLQNMLHRLIGADVQLVTKLDPEAHLITADAGQVEQVIMNLVVNARDAMPRGGELVIQTSNVRLDETYARQHAEVTAGPYVRLSVIDTGAGIPAEISARIFEPFFTTKEQGKGTGLGLATCYGIVKQAGGHIGLYSELGHGTTFHVYLPHAHAPGAAHDEEHDPAERTPSGTETVLLVEDDSSVRKFTRRLLDELGYRVLEAGNGDEALKMIQDRDTEQISLLITDVVMPQLGGKRLADQMQIISPATKIIFTSGYNEESVLLQGILKGEVSFLQKPYSSTDFARKVREVLDRAQSPTH